MDRLPVRVKLIIAITVLVSIVCGIYFSSIWQIENDVWEIIFFIILATIGESFSIALPNQISVSVVFAIFVCIVMLFDPLTAGLIIAAGNLLSVYKRDGKAWHILNTPFYKSVFNAGTSFISALASGIVYRALYMPGGYISLAEIIIPISVASLVYLAVNTSTVVLLVSNLLNKSVRSIWKQNVKWMVQNYLIMSPLGIILAIAYQNYGYFGILLFFGPLLMARYSFKLYIELKSNYLETIQALSRTLEAKDPVTSGHAERVSHYSVAIAKKLGLSEARIDNIMYAGLLHDIGKIGISDSVLQKPGRLTDNEYDIIKEHSSIGADILRDIDFLRDASQIIRYHHERYDGKGYPDGIGGEKVPLESYILGVADAFDAMTNDRPYRKALTAEEARDVIKQEAGKQFHPRVAEVFVKIFDKGLLEGAD
ncbi:MAG: HD-GYP domain-containing protein [Firmicutes bacterium]|nr:HD-GYP domain-containing protein [Bacillota bacterium]